MIAFAAFTAHLSRYSTGMLGSSSSVRVRKGRPADADALADVFRQSWQQAYLGIIPPSHLESTIRKRGRDWWFRALKAGETVHVIEVAGTLTGYATCGPARMRGRYRGEIYEIYLIPTCQGLGLGEHLFEACRVDLDARRLDGLVVWALAPNTRATDFYWRRGGRPVGGSFERFGAAKVEKIAFGWA